MLSGCKTMRGKQAALSTLRRVLITFISIYYQHDLARLPACPLTIHALLHIADGIKFMGPVWCYWAYPMERYCGRLQRAIRSRRFPYSALDRSVVESSQLTQISAIYDIGRELSLKAPEGFPKGAETDPSCKLAPSCLVSPELTVFADPAYVLLPPCSRHRPVGHLRRIAAALATRYGKGSISRVKEELNGAVFDEWGKVRRVDSADGDTMVCSSMRGTRADDSRDASFVRVCGSTS